METVCGRNTSVAAAAASRAADAAGNNVPFASGPNADRGRLAQPTAAVSATMLILALLTAGLLCSTSVLLPTVAESVQTDATDLYALHRAEMEAERERQEAYYPGKRRDQERARRQEPEQTLNLLDVEVSGAQDLRKVLEDKDVPELIYDADKEVETALNAAVKEDTLMVFACSWDTEQEEAEVEMKRGKFLGKSNNAVAFEVTTAEDDALFLMKMGLVDKSRQNNTAEKAALRFIKSETVLNTLLPEESPEMLLTRGFVVPLAIGKLKNYPNSFPLSAQYDGTSTVALYPMFACNLRYLIDNDLLVTDKAKMYFTVRLLSLVAWLHARGVIHLDLRPEHMLVTADGHGFLAGLENAAPADTMVKRKTLPGYVAPEMLHVRRRRPAGSIWHVSAFELDAWAAGYTVYQIWCGKPPLEDVTESNMLKVYRDSWGEPWDYSKCGRLPTIIVGLLEGLLAWEEERRLLPVEIFEEHLLEQDD